MAQIGCFIPALKAEIGIVDKIFTRIRTQENISKMQSSFEIDSEHISKDLALCTDKSLLLIDEYGKGDRYNRWASLIWSFCSLLIQKD